MTTILLARHGETDWNVEHRYQGWADPPLNDKGRHQAQRLAETLTGPDPQISAVYSSDLRRATETAEIVATRLGLQVVPIRGLREIDVGEFTGLTRAQIDASFPGWRDRMNQHGYAWEHGESVQEMADRVVAALLEIASAHDGETVLVVAHGGSVRAALAKAAALDIAAHRHAHPEPAGNCALFHFAVEDGVVRRHG